MIKNILIASDHAGYSLKQLIVNNCNAIDLGTNSPDTSVDYNDFADKLVNLVLMNDSYGILICKTGIGMSIAANRYKGIRAALCTNPQIATITREHNNANILVLPADVSNPLEIVNMFCNTEFSEEERHIRRIKKLG